MILDEVLAPPSPEQSQRLAQAVIQKAARFYLMGESPLGTVGEVSEFGQAVLKPDYLVRETLYGLHHTVEVDAASLMALVSAEDVIRVGLGTDPDGFPTVRLPDVDRALAAAVDWVVTNLTRSWGIG